MRHVIQLLNEQASIDWATQFGHSLKEPVTLTFQGDIGAGKTTFIRALFQALGVTSRIKSPTFALVESYESLQFPIHHFDLYRLISPLELDAIGFRDYFSGETLVCIEWPERAPQLLDSADIQFQLELKEAGRECLIQAMTAKGERILSEFIHD